MRKKPLWNRRILLTRERPDNTRLRKLLVEKGATVVEIPAIRTAGVVPANEDHIISEWNRFKWVVFTSPRAVKFFVSWAKAKGIALTGKMVGCVGRTTAKRIRNSDLNNIIVPEIEDGKHLAEEIIASNIKGAVCFVTPTAGVKSGQDLLKVCGWEVSELNLYETIPRRLTLRDLEELEAGICLAFFASPSALNSFASNAKALASLKKTLVLPIGKTTYNASTGLGLTTLEPPPGTLAEEIAQKMEQHFLNT